MVLAVVSVLTTLAAGVVAGVAMVRDDPSDGSGTLVRGAEDPTDEPTEPESYDYTGWQVVAGLTGDSGYAAAYRVPPTGWKLSDKAHDVTFRDSSNAPLVTGHSLATYYGNKCKEDGDKVAGGWTVLAETVPPGDLSQIAAAAARKWGRGFTQDVASIPEPTTETVRLADGTLAARAEVTVKREGTGSRCTTESSEIMVTTIDTSDGAKSLVQTRWADLPKGIGDADWAAISQSLEP